jgi:hypothetical protein
MIAGLPFPSQRGISPSRLCVHESRPREVCFGVCQWVEAGRGMNQAVGAWALTPLMRASTWGRLGVVNMLLRHMVGPVLCCFGGSCEGGEEPAARWARPHNEAGAEAGEEERHAMLGMCGEGAE